MSEAVKINYLRKVVLANCLATTHPEVRQYSS
jgi:hypothetical protein